MRNLLQISMPGCLSGKKSKGKTSDFGFKFALYIPACASHADISQVYKKWDVSQYCSARCLIVFMHWNSTPTSPREWNPFRVFLIARLPPFKNTSQNIYLFLLPYVTLFLQSNLNWTTINPTCQHIKECTNQARYQTHKPWEYVRNQSYI